ncbi:ABC transporter ATP-binding protein [Oscillospiraceae bacterium HV4-5-C5C]|nr:ABC transporter ATP-binding protein [Oscillospiraceae bacterium HV4-5-C5C]
MITLNLDRPFASFRQDPARPYIRAFMQHNLRHGIPALLFTLLSTPEMLLVSWLLGAVFDSATQGNGKRLLLLAVSGAGILAYMIVVDLLMYRQKSRFIHQALEQYKALAFRQLSQKSIHAFLKENPGRYISVLTNDINSVEENYLNRGFLLVYQTVSFIGALIMMLYYSVPLTLVAIALSCLPVLTSLYMGRGLATRERQVSDINEHFVAQVRDLLNGFTVIKSFKAEKEAIGLFDRVNHQTEQTKFRRRWWDCLLTTASSASGTILQLGLFMFGAYLAIRGQMTAGAVLTMTNLCNALLQPISLVPQYLGSRQAALGLIRKLAGLTAQNAELSAGKDLAPRLTQPIILDRVSFGYEPGQLILKDICLQLEPGGKYAVVGASGSGKSTLLNLLMAAGRDYQGSIRINGLELREIRPDSLYDLLSLIGQTVFLFDDTVEQNITLFRPFPADKLNLAIQRAGLAPLLVARGRDYHCGENGSALSGGERQRISIARALLREAPVLLLDEVTAALDNQTAFEVTQAILQLDGLTRLVVTHRLEARLLQQYDQILVLRDGRVCERGHFSELMAARGYFYSLYQVSQP